MRVFWELYLVPSLPLISSISLFSPADTDEATKQEVQMTFFRKSKSN
jgi:hypothetical protein